MTVLSPSLPPAICTTMSVRSFATCAMCEPSRAWTLAEATPRLNIAVITIPADTTKRPSFIIALREIFTENSLYNRRGKTPIIHAGNESAVPCLEQGWSGFPLDSLLRTPFAQDRPFASLAECRGAHRSRLQSLFQTGQSR